MNTLGSLLICGVQVTLVAAVGGLASLVLRRWLRTSAAIPLSATLVAVVLLTACAFSSWPSWLHDPTATAAKTSTAPEATAETNATPVTKPVREAFGWREMMAAAWKELKQGEQLPAPLTAQPVLEVPATGWTWLQFFGAVFALGVLVGLIRLIGGLWSVHVVVRNSRPLNTPELIELVDLLRAELGCMSAVEVRECSHLATAATVGWRKPVVLLSSTWRTWNETQLRSVVAHEIAHVTREDFAAGLVAQLGVVLHFYHPLVHWLERRLRLEQELAADALAANVVGGSRTYLHAIGELALTQSNESLGWPARSFLPTRRTFLRRIEMLRNLKLRSDKAPLALRWGTLTAIAAVTVLAVGLRPPSGAGQGGPGIAAAAQPAGLGAGGVGELAPALTPQFVPANAAAVISIRPAALIRLYQKCVATNPELAIDKARFPQTQDPLTMFAGCEQVCIVANPWQPAERRTHEPADVGFCLSYTNAQAREKSFKELNPHLDGVWRKKTFATFEYETMGPWARYLPDDRTIVFGSEAAVQKMMLAGKQSLSPLTQTQAWKQAAVGSAAIAVDTTVIQYAVAIAPPNPLAALFAPLWESATSHTVGITLDERFTVAAVSQAADEAGAEKIKSTVSASVAMLTNMVDNLAKSPEKELSQIATVGLKPMMEKHQLAAKGRQVTLNLQGDVASVIAPLATQIVKVRAAAQRSQQVNNVKQIMLALHNYHDTFGHFPAAVVINKDTGMRMSWRVAILPFVDAVPLYNAYKQDEPWDSEANKKILAKMPAVFSNPSQPAGSTNTAVVAAYGPGLCFEEGNKEGMKLQEIADGIANTIAVLATKTEIPWTKPEDLVIDVTAQKLPTLGFGDGRFLAGFADGSVRAMTNMIKPETLKALLTRKGGEIIGEF